MRAEHEQLEPTIVRSRKVSSGYNRILTRATSLAFSLELFALAQGPILSTPVWAQEAPKVTPTPTPNINDLSTRVAVLEDTVQYLQNGAGSAYSAASQAGESSLQVNRLATIVGTPVARSGEMARQAAVAATAIGTPAADLKLAVSIAKESAHIASTAEANAVSAAKGEERYAQAAATSAAIARIAADEAETAKSQSGLGAGMLGGGIVILGYILLSASIKGLSKLARRRSGGGGGRGGTHHGP